ncbi:MAG: filamentous hemagglutinin N-terminal domain-containing protein, partial [Magnetococcales bacterium]|nr:filamentous hemagglutinin N-terminal domain-containing protein [Magnetococcales bacterium]
MNKTYKSIWNKKTGISIAVSEHIASNGKRSSSRTSALGIFTHSAPKALASLLMMAFATNSYALPLNGVVSAGSASIRSGFGSMTITQSTPNAAINWQSFNIGQQEAVQFVQPNSYSVVLNRVLGADPSSILGSLSANGNVFMVNPNGILFGKGAQVNVAGLVASTRNITNSDLLAGNNRFAGTSDGTVLNQGTIRTNANGGFVALLGAKVNNEGVILAKLGTVALAAGNAVTLDVAGDGMLHVTVNQGAVAALVQNGGLIQVDGGHVLLTAAAAGNLLASAVNNTGVIQAQSIENHHGTIRLLGTGQKSVVNVGGTLDVSGREAGQTGGHLSLSGQTVTLDGAIINASGDVGGGLVLVGDSFHGQGSGQKAQNTTLQDNVQINADAIRSGKGGHISVWSAGNTVIGGTLTARGGANAGDGGFIETSGQHVSLANNTHVNTLAPKGKTGLWLLDPTDYTIATAGDESPASVIASLTLSDRTIATDGDIKVNGAVAWATPQTLTLQAGNDIWINSAVTASATGSGFILKAGNDVNISAPVTLSNINSLLQVTAGRDVTATGALTASANGARINVNATRDLSVITVTADSGGSINLGAGHNVLINGAISANGGPVHLLADTDGTGPGVAGGTVIFLGGGITSPTTTIRFNPAGYANTTNEIAAYITKLIAATTVDVKAWVFGQGDNKVYDATMPATLSFKGTPTLGGDVTLVPGTAIFDSKNVGTSKAVTFNGYALGGVDAVRFDLFATSGTTSADVTQRALTVTATGSNKIYDGLTTDTVTLADNRIAGDLLTVSNSAANFVDNNLGNGKSVSVTGINLTGADAANYSFNATTAAAANITPAPLTVTASDLTKVFGQTASPSAFTPVGLVNGETIGSVTATSPGSVATAAVAGYAITPSNATGGSFAAANYTIAYVDGHLTVTPAPLIVTASDVTKIFGQTATPAAFTPVGLLNGDTIGSITATSPGSVATATVAGYAITPSNATGGSFAAANYTIAYVDGH